MQEFTEGYRREVIDGGHKMIDNSFWTVKFFSPNTGQKGSGVVFLGHNQFFGGDSNYYYVGNYNINDSLLEGIVEITHFFGEPSAIFGKSLRLKIKLSGHIQEPVMKLDGHLIDNPSVRIEVVCTKLTSSPIEQKREGLFYNGQYYEAQSIVKQIFSNAKQKIILIDNYLDDIVLNLLSVKNPKVEVNIIAKQIKPAFKASAIAFNKQYGDLLIRTSNSFHDRFVIIDEQDYYHFGASIKDLGNLTFMFSAIEEQDIIDSLKTKFYQEWNAANIEV